MSACDGGGGSAGGDGGGTSSSLTGAPSAGRVHTSSLPPLSPEELQAIEQRRAERRKKLNEKIDKAKEYFEKAKASVKWHLLGKGPRGYIR
jgi:hypothetical protein